MKRLWIDAHGWLLYKSLVRGDPAAAATAFSAGEIPESRISLDIPGAVVTRNLILRDGVARAAHARGDLPAAIEIYRRLLANGRHGCSSRSEIGRRAR
jgi:hypothetical protein